MSQCPCPRTCKGSNGLSSFRLCACKVRLPITWAAFADALQPLDKATYGAHSADLDIVTVPDPFYKDQASFVTIPRQMLSDFLRQAKLSGLRVILDIHAYPGGASHGTYNGVWPLKCAFWTEKSKIGPEKNLTEVGMWIVEKMIHWIENLDFEPQGAIAGIVLMNEPGHMNRWKQFAADKAILAWLSEASARYSRSELPFLGIKLYMNLVETAFQDFEGVVVPWYHSTFSLEERKTRVVADVHYYMAWDYHVCDGRSDPFGAYSCTQNYQGTLRGCAEGNAKNMRRRWSQHDELVAVSEFSLGTFDQIDLACKELPVLETMLKEQLAAFAKYNFETIFWTWKMPYATDFQPGWSLKWLLSQHQERKK
ncbi:unnamed protein product [Symbiodinium pilosum]|uniref:Glycoside hydrolase family 5 domain-containing protein n=1 Tax=Symbiodinium pilosum TaxID=2952 RepID=A0A812IP54_SYMPI|nr:unnamed protein product [Symbiodinium pilosum]